MWTQGIQNRDGIISSLHNRSNFGTASAIGPRSPCDLPWIDMSPLPKPVIEARKAMAGTAITPETLYANLCPKLINKLASNFRNTMDKDAKQRYQNASPAERREWVAFYAIDPKTATASGYNKQFVFTGESTDRNVQWVTEEMMAGPMFLNSKEQARTVVKANILNEKPHELECLAAEGIKMYEFSWERLKATTGWKKEAGAELHTDLMPEEYSDVVGNMESSSATMTPSKKRKTGPQKAEMTQEQKN